MTKKGDMMKLSQEERTDLKIGINKLLIILVFLPDFLFAQIPFNGFCKIDSFPTDSGFTRIFSFNYDNNEYSDLILYNPLSKKAKLFEGKPGTKFEFKKDISFPLQPSVIVPIILPNNLIDGYAFTSRKEKAFGILKVKADGSLQTLNTIKFTSYPENISSSDIDGDGYPEFLLSGNSFDGLTLVSIKSNKAELKNIATNKSYLNARLVDINFDGFQDVVAVSSIDNTISFYFNNGRNEFTEIRKIFLNENILSFSLFDLNFDSIPEIIVGTVSSIKIYFGDETISYNNVISVKTLSGAKDFVIGDFNRDGYFDFNYLSVNQGKIVTIFAKDYYTYYPELVHTQQKGIVSIIPFFSKFVYGSAFVNENGGFNILSSIQLLSDDQQLAVAVNPTKIFTFDLTDNGINDLMFIDNDYALNFILRNASGVPDKLFSINLNEFHSNVIVFDNAKNIKTFFCFSPQKRVIEYLEVNFDDFSYKRNYLYADGLILDIVIQPDAQNAPEIFILFSKNGNLNLQVFQKTTIKFESKKFINITSDWIDTFIASPKELKIGYWSKDVKFISLNMADLKNEKYHFTRLDEISINNPEIISVSNYISKKNRSRFATLISDRKTIQLFAEDGKDIKKSIIEDKFGLRITNKNQLFFGKNNSIFINDVNKKSMFEIKSTSGSKKNILNILFKNIDVNNFTINNLDQRHLHLIYTSSDNSYINIKQLP
jgi:hypothetical protein